MSFIRRVPASTTFHEPTIAFSFEQRGNVARAVASVHQAGCVIGDINHQAFWSRSGRRPALIDADSFQVSTPNSRFLCQVGVPSTPRLNCRCKSLASIVRHQITMQFGLAIVIFQLLFMGRHPFVGSVRNGETPPLHEAIQRLSFCLWESRDVGMDQTTGYARNFDFG